MRASLKEKKLLKKFGIFIRRERRQMGWSLETMQQKQGYHSWRHLREIEAGKNFTFLTLFKISQALELGLHDLFLSFEDFLSEKKRRSKK